MKRILSILPAFLLCGTLSAQNQTVPVYFNQHDGTSRQAWFRDIQSATFEENNTIASFSLYGGNASVRYHLSALDSITFLVPHTTVMPMPDPSQHGNAVDPSDEVNYKNVDENVPSDENDVEYGDFIEHFSTTAGNTITFTFSKDGVTYDKKLSNMDIKVNGGHVIVLSEKSKVKYVLKGYTSNGSFKIDSGKKFCLELAGADITNPNGAAINIQSGKGVYLVLKSGTDNRLVDGETYTMVNDEDQKSTLFSEGQLLISGSGSLSVTSKSVHGICSDDYIRIRKGTGSIFIKAAVDAINTKKKFVMYGGTLELTGGDDGLVVRRGPLSIMGGKLSVTADDNALDASYNTDSDSTYINIGGGFVNIFTTGGKGHGVYTTGAFNMTGGVLQARVKGSASKAINCYNDMTLTGAKVSLMTEGSPEFNEEEADWSSAAGIRCRGNLLIASSKVSVTSSGPGGKGFNCEGPISFIDSEIVVATSGGSYAQGGENVRPRGIDAQSLSISGASHVDVIASHAALLTTGDFTLSDGEFHAFSTDENVKIINVKGTSKQTGGVLYEQRLFE